MEPNASITLPQQFLQLVAAFFYSNRRCTIVFSHTSPLIVLDAVASEIDGTINFSAGKYVESMLVILVDTLQNIEHERKKNS